MVFNQIDLGRIKVYDPREDGLTRTVLDQVAEISPEAAFFLVSGLQEEALRREVLQGVTLKDFLYGPEGYLARGQAEFVVFSNGCHLYSSVNIDSRYLPGLKDLSNEADSIPLVYCADRNEDEFIRKLLGNS
ncbi:hypothetical protein GF386_01200 [Candidatus Pacearchaeota archaeon]|nr:hypothetical protein [Candidatus Pacearchaeota archaeon]